MAEHTARDGDAHPLTPDREIEIAKFWVTQSGEALVVKVSFFKGKPYLDVRRYITDSPGKLAPPGKGSRPACANCATKPHGNFFLCHVPSQNMDNPWNDQAFRACLEAKKYWVQVESRKAEGVDGYKIDRARDHEAVPAPNWPKRSLEDLVTITFTGRMIDHHDHPALLRLIGAKQSLT